MVRLTDVVAVAPNLAGRRAEFTCKARRTADPPEDCDWPTCGCDPYAEKVLATIEEQAPGLFAIQRQHEKWNADLTALMSCEAGRALRAAVAAYDLYETTPANKPYWEAMKPVLDAARHLFAKEKP